MLFTKDIVLKDETRAYVSAKLEIQNQAPEPKSFKTIKEYMVYGFGTNDHNRYIA